jgi:uncharacterized protein YjbJ (UPF0337 family)
MKAAITGVEVGSRGYWFSSQQEQVIMDKDRIAGAAHEAKGSVKESVGKAVGDGKLQSDGKAETTAGTVQNAVGGVKDTLRDIVKK